MSWLLNHKRRLEWNNEIKIAKAKKENEIYKAEMKKQVDRLTEFIYSKLIDIKDKRSKTGEIVRVKQSENWCLISMDGENDKKYHLCTITFGLTGFGSSDDIRYGPYNEITYVQDVFHLPLYPRTQMFNEDRLAEYLLHFIDPE